MGTIHHHSLGAVPVRTHPGGQWPTSEDESESSSGEPETDGRQSGAFAVGQEDRIVARSHRNGFWWLPDRPLLRMTPSPVRRLRADRR